MHTYEEHLESSFDRLIKHKNDEIRTQYYQKIGVITI